MTSDPRKIPHIPSLLYFTLDDKNSNTKIKYISVNPVKSTILI
jgi:hypothetical protein